MSAPRPFETYPFHPPALFTLYSDLNFYIYAKFLQLFPPYGIYIVSWYGVYSSFTHALFQVTTYCILKSFCPLYGTR